jgi:hypothetical protein
MTKPLSWPNCDRVAGRLLTCTRGMTESLDMRRLTALLIVWVGLLGAIAPAFACAMPTSDSSCCPPDAPADCRQAWEFERLETVASPVPSKMSSVEAVRTSQHDARSPESPVITAAPPFIANSAQRGELVVPAESIARTDATLTYLKTGRLRL